MPVNAAFGGLRRRVARMLPDRLRQRLLRLLSGHRAPGVGRIRFGDLHRLTPVSLNFGFDRGLPVDRYYIQKFLAQHAADIRGRVLEIGDNVYTREFGGSRVSHSDVLHIHPRNPRATLVGDITDPAVLPENAFDCAVLTQTLQLIYDVPLAIRRIHRALAPGGVALITAPGISQLDRDEWFKTWFWFFTPASLEALFGEVFGPDMVTVQGYGNVFAATALLHGLAVEELETRDLDPVDPVYPVTVAVHARKRT